MRRSIAFQLHVTLSAAFVSLLTVAAPAGDILSGLQMFQGKDIANYDNDGIDDKFISMGAGSFRSTGLTDFLFSTTGDRQLWYVAASNNTGQFEDPVLLGDADDIPGHIFVADFDNDGYDDLFVLDSNGTGYDVFMSSPGETGKNVFANSDHDTLVDLPLPDPSESAGYEDADIADINGDGFLDVVLAGLKTRSSTSNESGESSSDTSTSIESTVFFTILWNIGPGTSDPFSGSALTTYQLDGSKTGSGAAITSSIITPRVSAADLNGDGYVDLAFCYHNTIALAAMPPVFIAPGNSDGTFTTDAPSFTLDLNNCEDIQAFYPQGEAVNTPAGQAVSAGAATLAIAFSDKVVVRGWASDWTSRLDHTLDGTARGPFGQIADYNIDGYADLMSTNGTDSQIMYAIDWDALSSSTPNSKQYTFGTDIQTGGGADFNGDGYLDAFGAHDSQILIYYQSKYSGYIRTYRDDSCENQISSKGSPTTLTTAITNTYHLKWKDSPVPNDEIQSVGLLNVPKDTVITFYDDQDGDKSKGYTTITVKNLTQGVVACSDSLDKSSDTTEFTKDYHPEEGFSTNIFYDVAGKVSRIVVDLP